MLGGRLTNDTRRRPLACFCTSWREEGRKEGRGEYGISSKGLSPGRTTSAALFRGPGNKHQPSRLAYKADDYDYDYEYIAALEALEMTRRDTSQAAKACERGHKTKLRLTDGHWPLAQPGLARLEDRPTDGQPEAQETLNANKLVGPFG
jgi:hypothetical protein